MAGIDKLDQLTTYYSFLHKSVNWWRKVFFWCMEVAVVNVYIIYKNRNPHSHLTHLAFRRLLIKALSDPIRSTGIQRSRSGPNLAEYPNRLNGSDHYPVKGSQRRDCVVCNRRKDGSRHLTLYRCSACPNTPTLCPAVCFQNYHTPCIYQTED